VLRPMYNKMTWRIQEKWIGTLQAAAVVRSLNLSHSLKQYVSKADQYKILDAGCGNGAPQTLIQARCYTKTHFVTVDYYNQVPSKNRLPIPDNITFIESDLFTYYCPNDCYNLIICMDVLEHLHEDHKMINLLSNWLKEKGILILHVPTSVQKTYFKNAHHSGRRSSCSHPGDHHQRVGYEFEELKSVLKKNSLRIVDFRYTFSSITWLFKEIYQILDNYGVRGIGIMALPFIYLSTTIDIFFRPKRGNGLLIIAQKL
jgi:2-polyprenyl-3-methyl-5-hydroxy-6-metoxy-1,4-benzoquinol methylase